MPAPSPLARQASIEFQKLGELLRTPVGMGMDGENNACASNHSLRGSVRLDELEKGLDLIGVS